MFFRKIFALVLVSFSVNAASLENDGALLTGTVKARKDVVIKSESTGVIRKVIGNDILKVKKGVVLASFSCKSTKAQIDIAEQKLALEKAKQKTKEEQFSQNAIGENEVKLSRGAVAISAAELSARKSESSKCYITTPFSGEVIEKFAQPGQYIKAGDPIAHVVDLSSLYGQSFIDRELWDQFKVGQKMLIKFRELDSDVSVREVVITSKPNYIYEDQRFRIEFAIADTNGLTSGMLYDIDTEVENGNDGQGSVK